MANFTDPDAVKRALQKTGASTNWLDAPDGGPVAGTDTAPVDYAPAMSYPQPPDKLPEQPVPQDPDKLPPQSAARMSEAEMTKAFGVPMVSEAEDSAHYLKVTGKASDQRSPEERWASRANFNPSATEYIESYASKHKQPAPPAAQMSVPADPPPQPATSDDGEVTVTVKTPRRAKPAAAPAPAPAQAAPVDIGQGQPPPNPYEVAEADGVEDLPLDLSKSSRGLKGDVAAAASRDLELLQERRDLKDAYLGQQQAVENKRAEVGAESLGRQRDTADATRETGDEYRKQMEAELAAMKEKMANPPKDTVGMVFGLISTLAALSGKAQGAAAIAGLGNIVNQRMKKWQGEIASNQAGMEGLGKLININELQGKNREAAEAELAKASAVEIISAAEAAKAQATTADQVAAADLAINEAKRVYSASELKARAQAAAAARRAKIYNAIGAATSAEEREAIAAANQDVGQSVLRDYLKSQGQSAEVAGKTVDVERKVADIGKTQAEATAAQADAIKKLRAAEKGESDKPMTEGDYKSDAIVQGASQAYARLKTLADSGKQVNRGAVRERYVPDVFTNEQSLQQRADVENLVRSILRSESGANVPEAEVEGKIKALGIDSGDPEVRQRGMQQLLSGFEGIDRQGRTRQALEKLKAAQAGTGREPIVRVVRSDGKSLDIPQSRAAALMKAAPGAYKIQQ